MFFLCLWAKVGPDSRTVCLKVTLILYRVLWPLLNGSSSPFPARHKGGFFSCCCCGNPVEVLQETSCYCEGSRWLGPPGVFKSQVCLHLTSSSWSSIVQVFLTLLFPLVVSQYKCRASLYLPVSPIYGTTVCPGPSSLVCIWDASSFFFSFSVSYWLLGLSGHFQCPCVRHYNMGDFFHRFEKYLLVLYNRRSEISVPQQKLNLGIENM